jgi:hypothetical protein
MGYAASFDALPLKGFAPSSIGRANGLDPVPISWRAQFAFALHG